jgi:hypothetical protein
MGHMDMETLSGTKMIAVIVTDVKDRQPGIRC